jgi:acyl-CoA reductase-like NAD-dependent aldehyde dehydrogenase
MNKLADLITDHEEELASLEAVSMGRPVSSYWDAKAAVKKLQYFATAGWNGQGRTSLNTPGFVNLTLRQPFGVVAAIIPWNVPVYVFINKVAPAVAAGNTVVLKSSEKAPLTVSDMIHRVLVLRPLLTFQSRQNLLGSSRKLDSPRVSSMFFLAMATSLVLPLLHIWMSD